MKKKPSKEQKKRIEIEINKVMRAMQRFVNSVWQIRFTENWEDLK